MRNVLRLSLTIVLGTLLTRASDASVVQLKVSVKNISPVNSIAFSPLNVAFHSGTYDPFDSGAAAAAPTVAVAELGDGSAWGPALLAADSGAAVGTIVPDPSGPLTPGNMASAVFAADTYANQYFSFSAMAVPSNDHFIGNDSPMQYMLFDNSGNLALTNILQEAGDIWDAGSETFDVSAAAFIAGSIATDRTTENGVVRPDFAEFGEFTGLETAPGYIFDGQLSPDLGVYSISFEVVPEPNSSLLMAIASLGAVLAARSRR